MYVTLQAQLLKRKPLRVQNKTLGVTGIFTFSN